MPQQLRNHLDFMDEMESRDKRNLPIFHVCSYDTLMDYLATGKVKETVVCEVFKQVIFYCFYGASKYKTGRPWKINASGDQGVCLILNLDYCSQIISIYPFDTGIASGTIEGFREYLDNWETLKTKLNLGVDKERINKFILHCFQSLDHYIDGIYIPKGEFELEAKFKAPQTVSHFERVHRLIRDQSKADERRYCVEVLLNGEFDLKPELVKGVIVPVNILEDLDFKKYMTRYRMQNVIQENSLFYPSSMGTHNELEQEMKSISIKFSKKVLNRN